ncbi:MAG: DUF4407 domain-containing protein [Paludibacter sp.]|nr:DUF4407 domain-containing protein [Paludibacter sp.]
MEIETNDIRKEDLLTTFFWWCSGAEVELLRQLPSETQKYVLIGTTVFLTTLLAALSGAYAFISVFQNTFLGISLGIMWSILIFILDRYTISMVSKSSSLSKTLLSSIPSLLITTIITVAISIPLSLKIFEQQIEAEHVIQVHESITASNSRYYEQQKDIRIQIHTLQDEIDKKQNDVFIREKELSSALRGEDVSRTKVDRAYVNFKKQIFYDAKREYLTTKIHNDSLIQSLNYKTLYLSDKIRLVERLDSLQPTFIDMIQTLSILKEKNNTINLVSLFLQIIFMLISTAPILIQIISREGPYNDYVQIRDKIQVNKFIVTEQDKKNEEELKSEIDGLKNKFNDFSTVKIEKMKSELVEQKRSHPNINFQNYFNKMLDTLSNEANKIDMKSQDFFKQGMVISIIGILIAFGILVFWLNYFSIKKFELYNIFELVSGTIIILLIEFLGAWFLKQHRILSEKSLHILKIKSILDRYLLSYLAINEFVSIENRESYLNQLLSTLDKDLRFPLDPFNSQDTSFAQEAFSSISNLTNTIQNMTKIK